MPLDTPYTSKRQAQWRGPIKSDEYNARVDEAFKDLTILFNRVRLGEVELSEFIRRVVKEHLFLTRKISGLENRLNNLENLAKVYTFHSTEQVDNDRFNDQSSFAVAEADRLTIDALHGVVVLPKIETSSLSKLLLTDSEGEEIIPPTLETRVVGDTSTAEGPGSYIDSVSPEFALYRRPGVIWERNVVVDTPHSQGSTLTLYVKVPTDLFTTEKSNCIVIHPFPHFGTSITEIAYTNAVDPIMRDSDGYQNLNPESLYFGESGAKGWVPPGGWNGDAAVNSGPRAFYFEPKTITGLRIRLHQDTYLEEAGKFVYSYGLSLLDLRYDKFFPEGRMILRMDAPEGETISSIDEVEANIWNISPTDINPDTPSESVFSWDTIWETAPDSGIYTREPVPNSKKVWLDITLRNLGGTPPALSQLVVIHDGGTTFVAPDPYGGY